MKTLSTLLLAAFVVTGCVGSTATVPHDNYYRILVPAPDSRAARAALPGVLSVVAFDADGLVRARPVLFTTEGSSHAVRQHNYHYWVDSPTKLVQYEIASYLKKRGLADSVVTPEMRVRADYELRGRIKRLERMIGPNFSSVAVELDLAVIQLSDRRLIVQETYISQLSCDEDGVKGCVSAVNRALADVFDSFAADIGRAQQAAVQ